MAREVFKPVPFVDGAYSDDAKPWSSQDTVNYLIVAAEQEGSRSPAKLTDLPGLVDVGVPDGEDYNPNADRHRGARNVEGTPYLVVGHYLYRWSPTDGYAVLGYIPGSGRVSMTHNQITNGNQLVIASPAGTRVYNTVTGVLSAITDPSFRGFKVVDYIDQMVVGVTPDGTEFQPSAPADALAYTTLETQEAEAAPDKIRTLRVSHQELLVFGDRTLQIYASTGQVTELFADKKAGLDRGCSGTFALELIDNTVAFLGNDKVFYMLRSGALQRISTHALEQAWADCDGTKAFCNIWEDRGHKVVYLTFPDGKTWGFDCATSKWHRRESYGTTRWRLNTLFEWDGNWYGGDSRSATLFRLDWAVMAEGDDPLIRSRTSGVLHDNGNMMSLDALQFRVNTGQSPPDGADINHHHMTSEISKNGGHSWGAAFVHNLGAAGQFRKPVRRRNIGIGREFMVRISNDSPSRADILEAGIMAKQAK